jgi:uncharacterized protein DUF4388
VKPSKTASPGRLLTQVAGEGRTGALVVGGHPGGTVFLVEGMVTYAESPAAPGVGELLTASGRLAARTWQTALDAGTSLARVGRSLVEHGHLTQGELELCVLGATNDAAYFALAPATAPVDFLDDAVHWLGPVVRIDAGAVNREARRRVRLLDEIFPDPRVDAAPVNPVLRPPLERITVNSLQWELLMHADGQRTPADLAQLLGRAGYATIQELRRLTALGLIEPPQTAHQKTDLVRLPGVNATAVDIHRPAVDTSAPPVIHSPAAIDDVPRHTSEPDTANANGTVYRPPRLARRKPGAKLPKELTAEDAPEYTGTDEVLLKRIRTALRALR